MCAWFRFGHETSVKSDTAAYSIEGLELILWSAEEAIADWRRLANAAAARFVSRVSSAPKATKQ
jgi:hypothetical protein